MNTGILATLIGLLALVTFNFDSEANARSKNAAGDTRMECSSPCSADQVCLPGRGWSCGLMLDDFS